MAHNKPSLGRLGANNLTVIEPSQIRDLDQQASESVNGDAGGSWAPESPIAIGGQGLKVTNYAQFTGKVSTGPGTNGLVLGDSDYPVLTTPRTRSFVIPIESLWLKSESQTVSNNHPVDEGVAGSVQALADNVLTFTTASYMSGWIPSFRLPNGATLVSAEFRFRVAVRPSTLPTMFPLFRVFRVPTNSASYTNIATNELYDYPQWQASFNYTSLVGTGYAVRRTDASGGQHGWIFRLVAGSGSSLGSQPAGFAAPASPGTNIVESGLTWQAEKIWDSAVHPFGNGPYAMPRGNMNYAPTSPPYGTAMDQYFAKGTGQSVTIPFNQNNTIDTLTYGYGWDIYDPSLTKNIYTAIKITVSSISSIRGY